MFFFLTGSYVKAEFTRDMLLNTLFVFSHASVSPIYQDHQLSMVSSSFR